MGQLLPGGRGYQADNGLRYRDYQSAANAANIDRGLRQVGSSIIQGLSNPLALINQFEAARKRGFGGGRSAAAGTVGGADSFIGQYQRQPKGAQRPAWEQQLQGGGGTPPPPLDLPAPITSPNTTFQNADDEYNRLKSQFGGTTGVSQLAGMASLPTGFTPTGGKQAAGLKDYYAAQQEVGERNIGALTESLAYKDPRYQKGGKLEQWAKANPMLAMREFNKLGYQTSAEMQGPSDQQKIRDAMSGGTYYPSEGSPSPVTNPPDFGTPANTVPGHPVEQGAKVMGDFGPAQRQAAQKTAGATGMPQLPTTPESQDPGKNFLSNKLSSPLFQSLFNTGGAMLIDRIQGIR